MSNSPSAPKRRHLPWVLIGGVFLILLCDFVLCLLAYMIRLPDELITGCVFGQVAFAAMLGGLMCKTWIAGWLLTTFLVCAGILNIFLGVVIREPVPLEFIKMMMMVPALTMGLCIPLAVMRSLRGWSLTRDFQTLRPRSDHRVEDLFLLSVNVACAIAVGQLAPINGDVRGIELMMLLTGFLLSWLFIVPVTAITFRFQSWWSRLVGYAALALAAALPFSFFLVFATGGSFRSVLEFMGAAPALILSWLTGILALLLGGYRLTSYAPRRETSSTISTNPFDLHDSTTAAADEPRTSRSRKQARWLTACVGGIAIACLVGSYYRDRLVVARYAELANPAKYFEASVASVDYRGGAIVGVVMAPEATEADLIKVAEREPQIERLSLAGTKFDDDMLPILNRFPTLQVLDLSGTRITDAGLAELRPVRSLALADTSISFPAAMEYSRLWSLGQLDLSGTSVTDDQIIDAGRQANSSVSRLTELRLARNSISDVGVSALFDLCTVSYLLVLSDTRVTGDSLPHLNSPSAINLDGTLVDDAVLSKLLALPSWGCSQLSLRRTGVTAAILPRLTGRSVAFGGGQITETDLLSWPALSFTELRLNGPEFTGEALASGKILVQRLDLSHSSVTDDVLKRLDPLGWINGLKLSHTKVSIEGLKGFNAGEIDLRHTAVSGADLLKHFDLILSHRIMIRHDNCSPEELLKLRDRRVVIDESSMWPEW